LGTEPQLVFRALFGFTGGTLGPPLIQPSWCADGIKDFRCRRFDQEVVKDIGHGHLFCFIPSVARNPYHLKALFLAQPGIPIAFEYPDWPNGKLPSTILGSLQYIEFSPIIPSKLIGVPRFARDPNQTTPRWADPGTTPAARRRRLQDARRRRDGRRRRS